MIAVIPKGVFNMSNRYVIINENEKREISEVSLHPHYT